MYLKSIEMRGFKSFADKTTIEFKKGVTCVVGPNGSGKSNITDAVRWVLGEQRIKTLRGAKMEDVIFNGTKHRKALGLAEVKLTFDNQEQFFPLDYDEISIVRRVHRSGESEYYINQMPCRLKDVRELFMDTGIGREGYSIIGQGRIDEVLSNNKDERRSLFEEAAGIVKYKGRKLESEKKLKATGENLLRIQDILSEIEDRVEPLKLESERAKKYLELTETLKVIELKTFAKRYTTCEQAILNVIENTVTLNDDFASYDAKQAELKQLYTVEDQALYQINHRLRLDEEALHEAQNNESKILGDKQLIQEKMVNLDANIERINKEVEDIEADVHKIQLDKRLQEEEREALLQEEAVLKRKLMDISEQKDAMSEAFNRLKDANANERQEAIDLLNQIEIKKREIDNHQRYIEGLNAKVTELDEKNMLMKASLGNYEKQKEHLLEKIDNLETQGHEQQAKLASCLESIQFFKDSQKKAYEAYEKANKSRTEFETEKKVLDALEKDMDGYDKGVKEVLKRLPDQSGIHGVLASLIEVPKSYETAIEIAMGKMVQNIVCKHIEDAKRSIEFLRKNDLGRVTFLPLENFKDLKDEKDGIDAIHEMPGFIGRASDLIVCDALYQPMIHQLLSKSIVVKDFQAASEMLKVKKLKFKLITLKGDVLVPGGYITGGSFKSRISNVLGRKRRIDELSKAIFEQTEMLESYSNEAEQAQLMVISLEDQLRHLRGDIDESRMEQLKLKHELEQHTQNLLNAQELIEKNERDADVLLTEKIENDKAVAEKASFIEQATQRADEIQRHLESIGSDIEEAEANIAALLEAETSQRIAMASLQQNLSFKERELARLNDDCDTLLQKKGLREKQIKVLLEQKNQFFLESEAIDDSIETVRKKLMVMKEAIEVKHSEKRSKSDFLRGLTSEITELSSHLDRIKEKRHKLDVQKAKLDVEKDVITSELWDKYEMSIAEALQVEGDLPKAEIKQLKLELKLLGTVNINAIKEYEEVSERYTFLTSQRKDLSEAMSTLEKIISDLDQQMIIMFKKHFELINNHFKDTFVSLFNGGDAELVLTDYDDLLSCDIDIIAQPPGKKLQSINLLSGGEKALTAIALLFAILKTKPSPFCILDEIEAALDDVNVYRFAGFIKDYAKHSQFVVITHRKGTMEVADTLYGVTMEEYGISKMLSVRLQDVQAQYQ